MGKAANFATRPSVKAYLGPLPAGDSGIEFTTDVSHDAAHSTPDRAIWLYPDTPGVSLTQIRGVDYAWIPASVMKIVP